MTPVRLVAALVLALAMSPPAATAATTRIAYVAGGTVYVDAGRLEGLAVGDTLHVVRVDTITAWLRVSFAASHRAACDTLRTLLTPAAGDVVRFTPGPIPAAPSDSLVTLRAPADTLPRAPGAARTPQPGRSSRHGLRGRVGLRYFATGTSGATTGHYRQVALDLRVDGTGVAGGRADLALDVRTRRTARSLAGDSTHSDASSRVYRASVAVHDAGGGRRLTAGRLNAPALSSISIFDGILLEVAGAQHRLGVFGGTQPEPVTMGLSGEILEYGVFGEVHQPPQARTRWSASVGAVSSRQAGASNRDFAFAQAHLYTRTLSGSFTQEMDVNRGWKRAAGEPALAFTSTFLSVSRRWAERLALNGGFDNRRSVRLYRDRLTPETDFDDRYRQGAWAGATLGFGPHVRVSGEGRVGRAGAGGDTHAWSAGGELLRLAVLNAGLRVRLSRFQGENYDSGLFSTSLRCDPSARVHVECAAGTRSSRSATASTGTTEHWLSGEAGVTLRRGWYLSGSYERDTVASGSAHQMLAGASYRF